MSQIRRHPSLHVRALLEDWERMGGHYLAGRAELLEHAIDWLGALDPEPAILEVGAGPGTTLRALRRVLPTASLVGVDNDPVLQSLHRMATSGRSRFPSSMPT